MKTSFFFSGRKKRYFVGTPPNRVGGPEHFQVPCFIGGPALIGIRHRGACVGFGIVKLQGLCLGLGPALCSGNMAEGALERLRVLQGCMVASLGF